jgi:CO/xanthine dehydrogenase Mo-binding subunit/aerobic-type carbon monoxide dehydrogenase small subunit (CoxS/CutS family)
MQQVSNRVQITFRLNGQEISAEVPAKMTLLSYLRDRMQLTGTKDGCSEGSCGTCMVLVDGEAEKACLLKMGKLHNREILTIEALAPEGQLHPVQEAFVEHGALQCGFCTPGLIISAAALLAKNPDPSDGEIRKALKGNICRCGEYPRIVASVRRAAEILASRAAGQAAPPLDDPVLARSPKKLKVMETVTGKLQFSADLYPPGVLHGKVLWAEYPHAEILSIDTREAEEMPGVAAVITHRDVPGKNRYGQILDDQPALCDDRVRYIGDPVAVVFAESPEIAEEAVKRIRVSYRPLEVVDSPERALEPDAPVVGPNGTNVLFRSHVLKGDPDSAWADCDVIIEGFYSTPWQEHAYLEVEAGVAHPDEDGGITIYVGDQNPHEEARQVAQVLGMPVEKVRIIHMPTGGSFGSKCDISVQNLLALGVLKTGRPCKLVFSRAESLRNHPKRHPAKIYHRLGAKRDGTLVAMEVRALLDSGAYASTGSAVVEAVTIFGGGPYRVPNFRIEVVGAYTNNPVAGAFRGFGVPQAHFAVEQQMDALARTLSMDPFALRELNALRPGDITAVGQPLTGTASVVKLKETLQAARAALERALGELPPATPGKRYGVGVASCFKNSGMGVAVPEPVGAAAEVTRDGKLRIRTGGTEIGQGHETALAIMASQRFGVPLDRVEVMPPDTSNTPSAGSTCASRMTMLVGKAVLGCLDEIERQACLEVAERMGLPAEEIVYRDGEFLTAEGHRLLTLDMLARLSVTEGKALKAQYVFVAPKTDHLPDPTLADRGIANADPAHSFFHFNYTYATQVAIVEVDEATGKTRVVKVISVHDVGKAINPRGAEGQIIGAALQGIGYALTEEFKVEGGYVLTDTFGKVRVPTIEQCPEFEVILVEDGDPLGPYGAKGVSEAGLIPMAAAICNAIYDAVGVRLTAIPAKPDKIKAALKGRVAASGT